MTRVNILRAIFPFFGFLSLCVFACAGETSDIKIGMAKSFLHEKPTTFIEIGAREFKEVLKKATGLDGDLVSKFSAMEIADKVQNKQLDFGVLYGHEFAWAQKKHPDLQPILIATNKDHKPRASVIVHKKSGIKDLADLKGKKIGVPMGTSEPARLFFTKLCSEKDWQGVESYCTVTKIGSLPEALDELARQKLDAVIVDSLGLEFYKDVKGPVFENNLHVLKESTAFPSVVIVCRKERAKEAVAKQFREGLLKVHTIAQGRSMMQAWNIDTFQNVPANYPEQIATVLTVFPPPAKD